MNATQEQPRKRIALNTACWDCYRNHRGCDGLRPCKRCVALGRAYSCRDPEVDERIPRKRKKPNPKDRGKGAFTIMDPQHFISPKVRSVNERCFSSPFTALDPSLEPTSPDRDFDCDNLCNPRATESKTSQNSFSMDLIHVRLISQEHHHHHK